MKVYKPEITHTTISKPYSEWYPFMSYQHDSDITIFKDRFVCMWNANSSIPGEGQPGQYNYLSVSDDFQKWSKPVRCFCSEGGAENPQDELNVQWQPSFINYWTI